MTLLLKKSNLDKTVLKNYRPISNLAFISNILEKAVMQQIIEHIEHYNLFCLIQSSYHTKYSTETALLKILNDTFLALDSGKGVITVLLDLSAAFNIIDHDILLSRLQTRIGIEGPALY